MFYEGLPPADPRPSESPKRLRGDMAADTTQTYVRMAQEAANHARPARRGLLAALGQWWSMRRRAYARP
jgi:hypothetical protein